MGVERPKLRAVDIQLVRHQGRELICLRDPLQYTDHIVTVSDGALFLLRYLDGEHTVVDLQQAFARATGEILPSEQLTQFVQELDQALLLDSARFAEHKAELVRRFRGSPAREAAHAGTAYPAEPEQIGRQFARHLKASQRSGHPGARLDRAPAAIVAPHIDLRVGGPAYARAYAPLATAPPVDTFLILGVAHVPTEHPFVGTKKDFQTPLGTVSTDGALMDDLAGGLPFDLYADELAHRSEHSIEFQVVYLQHVIGSHCPFHILPILVGSFHESVERGEPPEKDARIKAFISGLQKLLRKRGQSLCVVAGVDLAHVGGRFGDEFTVNEEVRTQLERDDRAMLERVAGLDRKAFFRLIHEEEDRRRVDGFPALYTMLSAMSLERGELLAYDQSYEKETNSVVTFASLAFW